MIFFPPRIIIIIIILGKQTDDVGCFDRANWQLPSRQCADGLGRLEVPLLF